MRTIGFIGIVLLLGLAVLLLISVVSAGDWVGIGFALFFLGLLAFFAKVLWRGRQAERDAARVPLAEGWLGESVTSFIRHQVLRSPEGIILSLGCGLSITFAVAAVLVPGLMGFAPSRGESNAVLFGMWPVLAFVFYVKICGPRFVTSIYSVVSTLAVVLAPFVIAYK